VAKGWNPRSEANIKPDAELVASVKNNGIIYPIIVRRIYNPTKTKFAYSIVDGERRYRAAQLAKMKKIPVLDRGVMSDSAALIVAVAGNKERKPLNRSEMKRAVRRFEELGVKAEQVAKALSVNVRSVREFLTVKKKASSVLKKAAQKSPEKGGVSTRTAAKIAQLPKKDQEKVLKKVTGKTREQSDRIISEAREKAKNKGKKVKTKLSFQSNTVANTPPPYKIAADASERCRKLEDLVRGKLKKYPRNKALNAQLLVLQCIKGQCKPTDVFDWDNV